MNYFLFKLSFHTPCHFGSSDSALSLYTSEDHFCVDTLFSALCHTARTLYGNSGVEALIEKAQKDQLFLSDAMPWCGERYYLPRPFLTARTDGHTAGAERKAMKNLAYIAVEDMADYLACMRGQGLFDAGRKKQCFGVPMDSTRAAVFEGQDTLPYHVGAFRFAEDCGLYVLAGLESDDAAWLRTLMRALGLSGIGGKVSSGYGKFTVCLLYTSDAADEL